MTTASPSTAEQYRLAVELFMAEKVYPAEAKYREQRSSLIEAGQPWTTPPVVRDLIAAAQSQGLWNLFLPDSQSPAHGLSVSDYAPIAELSGRSPELAPRAMNCSAPDTGNMEILHMFGTAEQQQQWLEPLLAAKIRSAFCMTEPAVASSDARNIQTEIRSVGSDYVITGRKWWSTGALDPDCAVYIVMGKTNPDGPVHQQQSMVIVPADTPGVQIERSLPVFGYHDQQGHAEITFTNVRVPKSNLLGEEGSGFAIAQARLGPGRIHHCMRAIGMAERALELMCARAMAREAFGKPLAAQGVIQEWIARSRIEIDTARLLTMQAANMIDSVGAKRARKEIAAIKVVAPNVALQVVDRAIQVFGGAGVSDDVPLASWYAGLRSLRIADGPDEVHLRDIARLELRDAAARLADQ